MKDFMLLSCESCQVSVCVPNMTACPSGVNMIGRGDKTLLPQLIEDTRRPACYGLGLCGRPQKVTPSCSIALEHDKIGSSMPCMRWLSIAKEVNSGNRSS